MIGGSVANLIGWRGIFYILLGIGVVITAMVIPVKETLPKDAREQGSFLRSFEGFILVCKVPNFAAFTTVFGLSMGALFAYISSTPFILQNEFGLSQFHFRFSSPSMPLPSVPALCLPSVFPQRLKPRTSERREV